MAVSGDGYLRPLQSREITVETDRLIAEVCPGLGVNQIATTGQDHPIWGPHVAVRVGAATDADLRHHAASGGGLSALLIYLLEAGVIDRVVQTAASTEAPLENVTVVSSTRDEVFRAAGSRYSPAAPLLGFGRELQKEGRFALVGKPCDVAAARALAKYDPLVEVKIPIMISFFCAGTPSLKGARKIVEMLGAEPGDLRRFQFRGDGWPGRARAEFKDGGEASMSYEESWGGILSDHLQFRCKICPDGTGGLADVVFADAWHCDDRGYPLFEDSDGRSLIVTRTLRGEQLLRRALVSGRLNATPLAVDEIEPMQPGQANRKRLVASRIGAMLILGSVVPKFSGFGLLRAAAQAGITRNIRSFLGTIRRIVFSRMK